jgi:hypothetical protein
MDGTSEASFLILFCFQLVLVDRVRARLYPDGQSSSIAYVPLTMHMQTTLQIGYLLSPSARSKPHHAHSTTGHGQPRAPAENTPTTPTAEPIEVCHFCPLSTRLGCLNDSLNSEDNCGRRRNRGTR